MMEITFDDFMRIKRLVNTKITKDDEYLKIHKEALLLVCKNHKIPVGKYPSIVSLKKAIKEATGIK